jgi:hypothetical protein
MNKISIVFIFLAFSAFLGCQRYQQNSQTLSPGKELDPGKGLIDDRLKLISSRGSGQVVDCGESVINRPAVQIAECVNTAF